VTYHDWLRSDEGDPMCGRFAIYTPASRIAEIFEILEPLPELTPRWNVAPTDPIPVVTAVGGVRKLAMARWGLIPFFLKDKKGPPLINARVEGIADKPAFRLAIRERRCLVPADGFYEWKTDGKAKLPYLIKPADGGMFAFAGVWESYRDADNHKIVSCTILTRDPTVAIEPFHDRFPVILPKDQWAAWLSPRPDDLDGWLARFTSPQDDRVVATRVSTTVNSVKNDVASCIEPFGG
jgi:putative SOS response-associated peptidase YedK